jgi:hypothetical protein
VVWQFFRHGIEVLVYIVYVSLVGLVVERLVSRPLPAELGGSNAFAHVLMMGAAAIAAVMLLRHIRTDLAGRRRVGRAASAGLAIGTQAAFGAAGTATLKGATGLRALLRSHERSPWDQVGTAVNDAWQVHGDPQPGYDPVPGAGASSEPGDDPRTRESPAGGRSRQPGPQGGDGSPPGGSAWGPEVVPSASEGMEDDGPAPPPPTTVDPITET